MYKIACTFSGGATAVPTEIIDRHLKLATAASFKVLLFIFRNPDGIKNADEVALCTGLSRLDAADALDFWLENGVIEDCDGKTPVADPYANLKSAPVSAPAAVPKKAAPVKFPTQGEVSRRISEDKTLSAINSEAQLILGTYGYRMQAVIVLLYDHYGFSPEVLITLLQYQKDLGSASPEAVKSRGEAWAKKGITSLEQVEAEIRELALVDGIFKEVKELLGLSQKSATGKIATYIHDWAVTRGFSSEMIILALKENGNSFSEANKQLKKWFKENIFSPEDIKEKKSRALPTELKRSYNTDSIGKNSVLSWLDSSKKEGNQS